MFKKIQPYLFLLIFFVAIFAIFRYSSFFLEAGFLDASRYHSYRIDNNRLTIETSSGFYEISFMNPDIAEVEFYNRKTTRPDSSHAVILHPDGQSISFSEGEDQLNFARNDFEVLVTKEPFFLTFVFNGDTLLREAGGYFRNDSMQGFRFALKPDEEIYGAGFRTVPTNRRGNRYELYNQAHYGYSLNAPNLNFSVPFVISSEGYGLLFDNAPRGILDIDSTRKGVMEFASIGGRMAYYVIGGQSGDSILNNYHRLTGYQPMPPRWALGNIQSRFGYRTQEEAERIVDEMIAAGYPLDALVIDLFWFGEGTHDSFYMGDLEWYRKNWPDPEGMIRKFGKKGVKTVLITEPFILKESKYYDTLSNAGMLGYTASDSTYVLQDFWFGKGGLFDIFQPRMRDWFWEKYHAQIEKGVDGWWGDLGEPERHPTDMYHVAGKADELHNIYAHYWHKMLWDRYERHYPEVRLFNLNRAGFAGSQRFSIYPWSGDVSRSWAGLQAQPTAVMGMTLSGFPYMHSDLGGFAQGSKDEELYVRWMQYGVFNPVFRPHGDSNAPVEPIFYSHRAQQILKRFIKLRYEMLPYNYTLAWLNSARGIPLTRPLFFEEPGRPELGGLDTTYLWGPNLLVAPVLRQGQQTRELYLPEGQWYDFFSEEKHTGGKWIKVPLEMETIPVFARAGGFIPLVDPVQNTGQYSSEKLILHYYIGEEGRESSFTMYEDDGMTKDAYGKGLYELLHFSAASFDEMLMFSLHRDKHENYKGMPETRTIEMVIHGVEEVPGRVMAGGDAVRLVNSGKSFENHSLPTGFYDSERGIFHLKFRWKEDETSIRLNL